MNYRTSLRLLLVSFSLVNTAVSVRGDETETTLPTDRRPPWTNSRVQGSPEPPRPYRAQRLFPHLGFEHPTVLTSAPGTQRLFVAEQHGRIHSIPDDRQCRRADLLLDVRKLVERLNESLPAQDKVALEAIYGLTFHPDFAANRKFYVCYVVRYRDRQRGQHPDGTRVVELKADGQQPPEAVIGSERLILTWLQGGHNGGCLKFGPDGMLYISTGDGGFAFPPDGRNSGQDVSNLLSAVLRIDVDRHDDQRAYTIPEDNPLVGIKDARGEIWAYGMRNPWKISFDRKTGELWVGDVGWELWELVYRVRPGDNYGWSLVEGRQPVHTNRQRGPTPIVPPAVEIPHTQGASITGGFVYRGRRLPELQGHYIFGDWETRRFWAVAVDGDQLGPRKELIEPTVRIVAFGETNDGELLLLDYDDGSIHEIVPNEAAQPEGGKSPATTFPRRLSETGLFDSVQQHTPATGVVPFSINASQWADTATAERWIGLPGDTSIAVHPQAKSVAGSMFRRSLDFPIDAVLMKTLSLDLVSGDPASRRRVETQLLHFNGYDWRGYSYRWNAEQTDAELVDPGGTQTTFDVVDPHAPGGRRRQTWRFHSRTQCIRCHNPWAEFTLAFNMAQLNRPLPEFPLGNTTGDEKTNARDAQGDATTTSRPNQLEMLYRIGVLHDAPPKIHPQDRFAAVRPPVPIAERRRLANPRGDKTEDVSARARAYLHVNCAHCHRFNGGGSAKIYLPFDTSIYKMEAVDTVPTQGTFGIEDARIVAPGDADRSVLYFRMAKSGPGHMPHLGAQMVDPQGLKLVHEWIGQLPPDIEIAEKVDALISLDESTVLAREQENHAPTRWQIAKRLASQDDRDFPTEHDMDAAARQMREDAARRAAQRKKRRRELVEQLLSAPRGASALARALRNDRAPISIGEMVVAEATRHDNVAVRDLFETFLPDDQKTPRLGDSIDVAQLLQMPGDAERGKDLFLQAQGIQCRNCHQAGGHGKSLGPDLSQIGKDLDRAKLLESLLEPSKKIDPKFVTWLVVTDRGKAISGLLIRRTDEQIVVRDAQHKDHVLAAGEVDQLLPQRTSLMPKGLLRDLTAQQAADLLAWLESLKKGDPEPSRKTAPPSEDE